MALTSQAGAGAIGVDLLGEDAPGGVVQGQTLGIDGPYAGEKGVEGVRG